MYIRNQSVSDSMVQKASHPRHKRRTKINEFRICPSLLVVGSTAIAENGFGHIMVNLTVDQDSYIVFDRRGRLRDTTTYRKEQKKIKTKIYNNSSII